MYTSVIKGFWVRYNYNQETGIWTGELLYRDKTPTGVTHSGRTFENLLKFLKIESTMC